MFFTHSEQRFTFRYKVTYFSRQFNPRDQQKNKNCNFLSLSAMMLVIFKDHYTYN